MRILITGITGFVGSHLADYLLENQPDAKIFGCKRHRSSVDNISHIDPSKLVLVDCDLVDYNSVLNLLRQVQPDIIFHLAAQSFVPTSFHSPIATLDTNIKSTINLLDGLKELNMFATIMHVACSSEQYGKVHLNEVPIFEDNPFRPMSPYAVSKIAQEFICQQYHESYGFETIVTRAFNHTGPRRGEVFVCSNFAKQIAMIEAGLQEPKISVGNLHAIRDFTDVRDTVRAYWQLALMVQYNRKSAFEHRTFGSYNIASGAGWRISEVLNMLMRMSPLKDKIGIFVDPAKDRPSDVPLLIGSYSKLRRKIGWEPQIPFNQTLKDILDYWRKKYEIHH